MCRHAQNSEASVVMTSGGGPQERPPAGRRWQESHIRDTTIKQCRIHKTLKAGGEGSALWRGFFGSQPAVFFGQMDSDALDFAIQRAFVHVEHAGRGQAVELIVPQCG
jgi:hypothetical protein